MHSRHPKLEIWNSGPPHGITTAHTHKWQQSNSPKTQFLPTRAPAYILHEINSPPTPPVHVAHLCGCGCTRCSFVLRRVQRFGAHSAPTPGTICIWCCARRCAPRRTPFAWAGNAREPKSNFPNSRRGLIPTIFKHSHTSTIICILLLYTMYTTIYA